MEFYHLYPSEFQDLLQHDYGKESYIGQEILHQRF